MADTAVSTMIGPEHDGTPMPLGDFARVHGRPGYRYELERGVIVVVDVPGLPHELVNQAIRDALVLHRAAHPSSIFLIAEASGCALRLPGMESERHPDLTAYMTPPPVEGPQPWDNWAPDLVVEVVSESSEKRDYVTKRDEYLKAGVRVYWIVDPQKRTATVLTRRGDAWDERQLDATATLELPMLFGFELSLANVFAVLD